MQVHGGEKRSGLFGRFPFRNFPKPWDRFVPITRFPEYPPGDAVNCAFGFSWESGGRRRPWHASGKVRGVVGIRIEHSIAIVALYVTLMLGCTDTRGIK